MDITEYLTTADAAKILGYNDTKALSSYCSQGRIPGVVRISNRWLIPKIWVEAEQKNPSIAPQGGRGNPRKSS